MMIKAIIFDWGDTIMRDYALEGPMYKWPKVGWISGAEGLLKSIQGKYKCVIATSADHSGTEDMIEALRRINADKYFQGFYSQKELGYKKPDPRFFKAVVRKESQKPEECIMIGNMYEKDIVGAKKAGLKTIFFNENKLMGDYSLADKVVFSLNEISVKFIEKM
jgi:putative hydrolase of the HAD superfamily